MVNISVWSVLRFSIQLMIGECAFLAGRPHRDRFWPRMAGALAVYFLCAGMWYAALCRVSDLGVLVPIVYYIGLFILTMAGIRFLL